MSDQGHHGAAAHHSPDDQYLMTPPGAGYEHTDASIPAMVRFGFWLAVATVLVQIGLAGAFWFMRRETLEPLQTKSYPLAADSAMRLPAEPRLQQIPVNDIYEFRTREQAELDSYGWKDKAAGIVHIPIADAMRLTIERGLPSREVDPTASGPPVGLMPTDASAGRVMERRRE